jgi:hypothetical protein
VKNGRGQLYFLATLSPPTQSENLTPHPDTVAKEYGTPLPSWYVFMHSLTIHVFHKIPTVWWWWKTWINASFNHYRKTVERNFEQSKLLQFIQGFLPKSQFHMSLNAITTDFRGMKQTPKLSMYTQSWLLCKWDENTGC